MPKFKDCIIPLIILVSDDTILFGTNCNSLFIYLKYFILLCICLYLLGIKKKFASSRVNLICLSLCGIIVLSSIINRDIRLGLIYKVVILSISGSIVQLYSLKEFSNKFIDTIYFLASFSLVCYFINLVLPQVISLFPKVTNTSGQEYYNLLFYTQQVGNTSGLIRNEGCFREAGVFQMFLNLALVFQIYFTEKFSIKRFFVIFLALGLTFSTTAYAIVFLVIILFLLSTKSSSISKRTRTYVTVTFVIAVAVLMIKSNIFSAEGILFSKFSQEGNDSSIARLASVTSNFEIWKNNPLLGSGLKIDNLFESITFNIYGVETEHNTNTLLYELATWGIIYFLILLWGLLMFSKRIGIKLVEHFTMLLIIIFLSIGEKLVFSTFFYVLMFYGYNSNSELNFATKLWRKEYYLSHRSYRT